MIKINRWRFKSISKDHFKIGDFQEQFEIWYGNRYAGSLFYSPIKRAIWARISDHKLNKKFYRLEKQFFKLKTYKYKQGNYILKSGDIIEELTFWNSLDTDMQNHEKLKCMAIIPQIFKKNYKKNVSKKRILIDLEKEHPQLVKKFGKRQLKKSIIKIFQFPDLNLKIRFGSYKRAKEKIEWGWFNV